MIHIFLTNLGLSGPLPCYMLEPAGMGRRSTFWLGLSWRNHQRAAWHVRRRGPGNCSNKTDTVVRYFNILWSSMINYLWLYPWLSVSTIIRKLLWLSMIICTWVFTYIYFNQSTCNDPHGVTAGKVVSPVKKLQAFSEVPEFFGRISPTAQDHIRRRCRCWFYSFWQIHYHIISKLQWL